MSSKDWTEGPRPSFFGQLPNGPKQKVTVKGPSGRENSAFPRDSSGQDTQWAEPLAQAGEETRNQHLNHEREAYVHAQFNNSFASEYIPRQLLALATTLALTGICWFYVPTIQLLAWVCLRSSLAGVRILISWRHRRHGGTKNAQANATHARRMLSLAILSGVVLGAAVLLFFGRTPASLQFMCWFVLAGAVTLPIHSLALDPPRVRGFVNAFFTTVVACILYRILTTHAEGGLAHDIEHRHYDDWFIILPLVHWFLLLYVAKRVQFNATNNFELEFYKQALIDTLAEKQQQAEEAVRIKNRFIATAAHDMRQPVMALSLYAEHLKEAPEDQEIVLPKIANAAATVNHLFDSLFDLARIDNHQLSPRMELVEVCDVVTDLQELFEPVARAKGIELKMRCTTDRKLETDPVLVRRMIGNVVSNAIKYTQPDRKVLIAARTRGSNVAVEVWDQGYGMEANELRKIFTEFYKIEGPSENHEGFGLGLSIVARLAHALGARISVRSRPARGTVFRLALKAAQVR